MRSYQILLVLFVVGLSVQNQVYLEAVSCAEGCYYQQFAQSCLCADGSLTVPIRSNVDKNHELWSSIFSAGISLLGKGIKFGAPIALNAANSYFNKGHLQAMQPPQAHQAGQPEPNFVRRNVQKQIENAHLFEESYENIV